MSQQLGGRQYGLLLQRMLRFLDHFTADELVSNFVHLEPGAQTERLDLSGSFIRKKRAPHATPGPKGSQTDRLRAATWERGRSPQNPDITQTPRI